MGHDPLMRAAALIALGLAWVVVVGSASAEFPPGYQLVVRGATVDAQALPPLVLLPTGPFSTIGLGVELLVVPHQDDDWILYDTGAKTASVVQPTQFSTSALTATYYDPTQSRTRAANVIPGASGGQPALVLDGGESDSLANWLQPAGAVVVIPVPEPAVLVGLAAGAALLALLRPRGGPRSRTAQRTR